MKTILDFLLYALSLLAVDALVAGVARFVIGKKTTFRDQFLNHSVRNGVIICILLFVALIIFAYLK